LDSIAADDCGGLHHAVRADGRDLPRQNPIVMRDDFTYDPPLIEIVPEEVVEFQISNEGGVVHEFLVGDEARQAEFEREMAVGGHEAHGAEAPGVSVEPGEEESFVFKFPDKERELFYGCHEPGHYAAGMKGSFKFGTEG